MWVVWGWKWVVKLFGWLVVGSLPKSVLFVLILMWFIRNFGWKPSNRLQPNQRQLLYTNSTNNCRLFILKLCRFSLTDDLLGWRYLCFQLSCNQTVDSSAEGDSGLCTATRGWTGVWKKHDGFVTQMSLLGSHRSVKWEDISMTVYLPNMSNYSAHHADAQVIWNQEFDCPQTAVFLVLSP